jgi:hypothetical protein
LSIYSISGKRVALLEQQDRRPGEYSVRLGAAAGGAIPSGLYVYCFQAGSYQESNLVQVME